MHCRHQQCLYQKILLLQQNIQKKQRIDGIEENFNQEIAQLYKTHTFCTAGKRCTDSFIESRIISVFHNATIIDSFSSVLKTEKSRTA